MKSFPPCFIYVPLFPCLVIWAPMSAATSLLILFFSFFQFLFFFYLLISRLFPFIYGCSFFFNITRYVLVSIFTAASLISTHFSIIYFSPCPFLSIYQYSLSVFSFISILFTFHLYRLFFYLSFLLLFSPPPLLSTLISFIYFLLFFVFFFYPDFLHLIYFSSLFLLWFPSFNIFSLLLRGLYHLIYFLIFFFI